MAKSALLTRLQTAYERTKDPLKKARLKRQMVKLSKKLEVGKAKSGDPFKSLKEKKTKRRSNPLLKFIGNLGSGGGKKEDYPKVEADDWWGEDEDPDWWKAKPEVGRPDLPGFKHGGRIKKTKKRKPRGVGVALRGYGKVRRG
jgi:hypothetical protein